MADSKISALASGAPAQAGDEYVVARSGANYKLSLTDIAASMPNTVISVNTSTDALRITQVGSGNALLVEDSANPDASPTVITATGNVGIGTTSPVQKFVVADTNGNLNYSAQSVGFGDLAYGGGPGNTLRIGPSGYNNGSVSLMYTTSGGVRTDGLRIDSVGNVGIGTTSPARTFAVFSAGSIPVRVESSGTDAQVEILTSSGSSGRCWVQASSGALTFGASNAERARIDSSGNLGIGTTSPSFYSGKLTVNGNIAIAESGRALFWNTGGSGVAAIQGVGTNELAFLTTGSYTERMRITSAGELLVGGTTAISNASGAVTIQYPDAAPILNLYRNDTTITAGNSLGNIYFHGNDTTSNTPTILAAVQGVASDTHAAGDNPTDIVFATTPDGTATVAEAGRVTQAGSYVLKGGTTTAAAGVGIIFPATQVASANANSLDDYEEGTWTPTAVGQTTPGTTTYTTQTGVYTKIGREVTASFDLNVSNMTGTGILLIDGLPFTSSSSNLSVGAVAIRDYDWTAGTSVSVFLGNSRTYMNIYISADNAIWEVGAVDASFRVNGTISYIV